MDTQYEYRSRTTGKMPFINTLSACLNKALRNGYKDNLTITNQGLYSCDNNKTYGPGEVRIIAFYRFEGQTDPEDNAVLYIIEATNGVKGTIIDNYGNYADENINNFMAEVGKLNEMAA